VKRRNSQLEIRNSVPVSSRRGRPGLAVVRPSFAFPLLLLAATIFQSSCASPAEPQPPRPIVPAAITDLAARQRGDGALLTFTPPAKDVEGDRLTAPPSIEILRGFAPVAAQAPASGSLRTVYTVPGSVLDTYQVGERVEIQDPIKPDEVAAHAGERMFYIVRGRASKKAASEDSNIATFLLRPAPSPISDLRARVVESGVQLNWDPPATVSGGAPLTTLGGFRIYRAETEPRAPKGVTDRQPAVLAGVSPSPDYLDTQIEWGKSYLYTVRSVAQYGADAVESGESRAVEVAPRDVFPPAAPLELIAVFVPAAGASPAAVELSWAISPEPDAAGYYVYRSGEGEEKAQRITPALLPTPAFRDISIRAGGNYTYTVTAVDRAGNESQPGKPVSLKLPKAGE